MPKITLIGAGSGCFSLGLVRDLCSSAHLSDSILSLMDINEERLNATYELCIRYRDEIGGKLKVEKTLNRIEALKGANYVITTALAHSYTYLMEEWKIAEKHGFQFYGSAHVKHCEAFYSNFYQLRLFESITQDILTYCPDAWHLLIANPVLAGTTYIQRKYPTAKIVGICHGGYGNAYKIADAFGCKHEDYTFQMSGVNHFVWMTKGNLKDKDLFTAIDEAMARGESPLGGSLREYYYREHGVIGLGDTLYITGAAWPWHFWSDEQNRRDFGFVDLMDGWNSVYFDWTAQLLLDMADLSKDKTRSVKEFLKTVWVDDLTMPLIESLECNIPRTFYVNVLNKGGIVPGIPENFSVEVQALCQKDEIRPIQVDPLPPSIIALTMRDRLAPVEMEIQAFITGKMAYLEELVLMDKWAASLTQVRAFIKEIMDLPHNADLKAYYGGR